MNLYGLDVSFLRTFSLIFDSLSFGITVHMVTLHFVDTALSKSSAGDLLHQTEDSGLNILFYFFFFFIYVFDLGIEVPGLLRGQVGLITSKGFSLL